MIINKILKDNDEFEKEDEDLRKNISELSKSGRKEFFKRSEKAVLDPDTYSTIHWLLYVGGFHNLYLKEYKTFGIEFSIGIIGFLLFLGGLESAIFILFALYLIELPALFFSQKIVKIKNYEISKKIYDELKVKEKYNTEENTESIKIENE